MGRRGPDLRYLSQDGPDLNQGGPDFGQDGPDWARTGQTLARSVRSVPGRDRSEQRRMRPGPGRARSGPGRARPGPGRAGTGPGRAGSRPGRARPTIPHKNYETTNIKVYLCLPSPLQSNVACDEQELLLYNCSSNNQHCLKGGGGTITSTHGNCTAKQPSKNNNTLAEFISKVYDSSAACVGNAPVSLCCDSHDHEL